MTNTLKVKKCAKTLKVNFNKLKYQFIPRLGYK